MKLYLDDFRNPDHSTRFMYDRIGLESRIYSMESWLVVRNYQEFIEAIKKHAGELTHVSFDHDLADGHYHKNMQEGVLNYEAESFEDDSNKTGYHCAKFFKEYYEEHNLELPVMYVHSMNPVGTQNIINLFKPNTNG